MKTFTQDVDARANEIFEQLRRGKITVETARAMTNTLAQKIKNADAAISHAKATQRLVPGDPSLPGFVLTDARVMPVEAAKLRDAVTRRGR